MPLQLQLVSILCLLQHVLDGHASHKPSISYTTGWQLLYYGDIITHIHFTFQVDGDSVMDVEIASTTQLTDSAELVRPQNVSPRQHANDTDSRMDLDGDTDSPKRLRNVHGSKLDVLGGVLKWDLEKSIGTHTQTRGRRSLDENLASGDGSFLAGGIKLSQQALVDNPHDAYTVFGNLDGHEDDDSEWLDSASVRADTQSIIAGDSEEEADGETGEDDDEMLSGDEAVIAGAPDVVKAWD